MAVAAPALRTIALARREAVVASLVALGVGGLLAVLGPPAGDAAAHLYRADLVREGVLVWDAFWYGGHYPLASYSVLFPPLAALAGVELLCLAAVVAAAGLFAVLASREWGRDARWPSRAFAVLACAPLYTGTYPFAAGIAALVGALVALQAGRRGLAFLLTAATIAFSPLAFAFLCACLAAVALDRRPPWRRVLPFAVGTGALAAAQLALWQVFPTEGRYDFRARELAWALVACGVGGLLAWRTPRARVLAFLFGILALLTLVAFAVDSPLGSTVTRFRAYVFPLVLLVVILSGARPRALAALVAAAALFYTVSPYAAVAVHATRTEAAEAAFWAPVVTYLAPRLEPGERVDVIPTFDNWEALHLPRAGIPIARGWYRQLDLARNPVLYEPRPAAADYRAWLRREGVRFVVLPATALDRLGALPQAELLRSGSSGLVEVWSGPGAAVYELPDATPLVTGPGSARVVAAGHDRLTLRVGAPGAYLLRLRYTPYLVASGEACLEPGPDSMTRVVARRAGTVELGVPGAGELLRIALGSRPACP